jgi:CRISPR/Cas system CSM-associated protein Csm2 small subunit
MLRYKANKDSPERVMTTIGIPVETLARIENRKLHPREPYYSVIERLLDRLEHGRIQG